MNSRKLSFITLVAALPLALIVPLRASRSWQPRVLKLPLNPNASSLAQSDIRELFWRPNGLLLVTALSDAWREPREINNWNGSAVSVRSLRAQNASLDKNGDLATLIYNSKGAEMLDIWDVAHEQNRFAAAKRITAACLDARQTFGFPAFEISPNGQRVAWNNYTPAKAGTVGIADARDGREVAHLAHQKVRLQPLEFAIPKAEELAQSFEASALAWSPDSQQLAVVGINLVCVINASNGRIVRSWKKPFAIATRAQWSPDGQKLAIWRGDVNYWTTHDSSPAPIPFLWVHDVSTGKVARSWSKPFGTPGTGGSVTDLSWAPDSKVLAWGTFDAGAFRMNISSGAIEKQSSLPTKSAADKPQFVAFAPDGNTIAVATQSKIQLWRIN